MHLSRFSLGRWKKLKSAKKDVALSEHGSVDEIIMIIVKWVNE